MPTSIDMQSLSVDDLARVLIYSAQFEEAQSVLRDAQRNRSQFYAPEFVGVWDVTWKSTGGLWIDGQLKAEGESVYLFVNDRIIKIIATEEDDTALQAWK